VLLHDEQGHSLQVSNNRGDQHLTMGLLQILPRLEESIGMMVPRCVVVDREGMAAPLLRDLQAQGYTVMTVCKLALTNLVMWTRDHYFPQTYAHATWGRLLPFFQLPGLVTVDQSAVSVTFRPFNDRQLNEDLTILCQRVSKAPPHLPDGRQLLFTVGNMRRPILDQHKRCVA